MNGREEFVRDYNVPRGTLEQFDKYAELLVEWQTRMNLVGPSTIEQLWQRHFADSAQLVDLAPKSPARWLDIGAGAGFPGVVVALLADHRVTLVESTSKKCTFLKAVVDELGISSRVTICNARAESLSRSSFELLSARACAPLVRLFALGYSSAAAGARWLLLKGENVAHEVDDARLTFDFSAELIQSRSDQRGRVVVASNVRRKVTMR